MQYVAIKDVARALFVSVAPVSRAFNDKYDVKKETRELILRKAVHGLHLLTIIIFLLMIR